MAIERRTYGPYKNRFRWKRFGWELGRKVEVEVPMLGIFYTKWEWLWP